MKVVLKKFVAVFVACFLVNFSACHVFAVQGMKLYRNREYHFSIEIPEYLQYTTPRVPNIKMVAVIKDFSMNILVKPEPSVEYSTDEILSEIYLEQVQYMERNFNGKILEAGIISIPQTRVLYFGYLARYDYPRETFFLTGYCFQFIRHRQAFCITYLVEPGKENLYKEAIIDSIGSFVDETDFY